MDLLFCGGDGCDKVFCLDCGIDDDKFGMCTVTGCSKQYCKDCQKKETIYFWYCDGCHGTWCDECNYSKGGPYPNMCFGKGGCYASKCQSCLDEEGECYVACDVCDDTWCPDCDPGVETIEHRGKYNLQCCPACEETLPTNQKVQLWLSEQKEEYFFTASRRYDETKCLQKSD
jgi:hypothetical protein